MTSSRSSRKSAPPPRSRSGYGSSSHWERPRRSHFLQAGVIAHVALALLEYADVLYAANQPGAQAALGVDRPDADARIKAAAVRSQRPVFAAPSDCDPPAPPRSAPLSARGRRREPGSAAADRNSRPARRRTASNMEFCCWMPRSGKTRMIPSVVLLRIASSASWHGSILQSVVRPAAPSDPDTAPVPLPSACAG